MANSEAYESGFSRGWDAANYAEAYEGAVRYSAAPEPKEFSSGVKTDHDRDEFTRGHEDGWTKFMNEDYPA
ncbi:hypothetical protein [Gordonia malaquae]|uniref:hypothetical protein n=1 Tax=Gordonia malaquae TaxID=410332 RepID=UPI0030164212